MSLETKKHIRYFERNLVLFPRAYEGYDSSHSSLVYLSVLGLKLLGQSPPLEFADWVWKLYVENGFVGSLSHTKTEANLGSTYFCLCISAMMEGQLRADRHSVVEYIKSCQLESGTFCASARDGRPYGEPSLRHMYSALGSLYLLGVQEPTLTARAASYAKRCQNFDGGFGDTPGFEESHAGLTFCALACILVFCGDELAPEQKQKAIDYLVHCQQPSGGFVGRPNKTEDTCYSFWATASLHILGECPINDELGREFLLATTQHKIGGFAKVPGEFPDPLHSALGLAALSLMGQAGLEPIDATLCLPRETLAFVRHNWV